MKNSALTIYGIAAAAIAAILIICHASISASGVVIVSGIAFVAVGLFNLLLFSRADAGKNGLGRMLAQVANGACIVLGVCMLAFRSTFSPLVAYIFGIFVALCALWQFFLLAAGVRPLQLPAWLYALPLATAGASAYILINASKPEAEPWVMLATGIGCALLAACCLLAALCSSIARKRLAREGSQSAIPTAQVIAPAEAGKAPGSPSGGQPSIH